MGTHRPRPVLLAALLVAALSLTLAPRAESAAMWATGSTLASRLYPADEAADATPAPTGTGTTRWVTAWTTIRTAPEATAAVEVTVGPRYPVVLAGGSATDDGVAWLRVTWASPSRQGTGWIGAAVTTTTRSAGYAYAGMDALSPSLAAYLTGFGPRAGAAVYDATRRVMYLANAGGTYITASSIKVPIMLAVMARAEAAHRSLTAAERSLLTVMIERSDNAAASILYALVGGRVGITAWARKFGISGLVPEGAGRCWGYSSIRPSTMVTILERLRGGRLVNAANRAYALGLMRSVVPWQQFGVGAGSPAGSTVAMKNGWVVGPDGRWAVNSSGIVSRAGVTWVVSVYTRGNASFSAGTTIVTRVARWVGAALA